MLEKRNKTSIKRLEKCNLSIIVEVVDNRIYIPIYMIMFFQKKVIENNIINFDFSALKEKN